MSAEAEAKEPEAKEPEAKAEAGAQNNRSEQQDAPFVSASFAQRIEESGQASLTVTAPENLSLLLPLPRSETQDLLLLSAQEAISEKQTVPLLSAQASSDEQDMVEFVTLKS